MDKPYQPHSATSIAAAEDIGASASSLRALVYQFLKDRGSRGATDEEVYSALDLNPSTERPRRVELVDRKLVEDSGVKRATRSGMAATVWIARQVWSAGEQGDLFA